jgi:hypothetical protein
MENYDIEDFICPECGHEGTRSRDCISMCDDGWFDQSEEEYMNPGTAMFPCDECKGTGIERWCPSCHTNLSGRRDIVDPNPLT